MSNTRVVTLPDVLRRLLSRFRRRGRLLRALAGTFLTLGVLIACVGAAVAMDRVFRLPPSLRAVSLGFIATVFLFLLVRAVLRPILQRMSYRRAASRLGGHFPGMREDLVSAVELSDSEQAERGVSHSLIASVIGKIASRAAELDHRIAVPLRPILKFAAVFILFAAFFQTAYVMRPEAVRNALYRIFQPTKAVPYFCYTTLDIEPGDCVIRTGDTVEVLVRTSGRAAEEALLESRNGSDPLHVRLTCDDGGATWCSGALFEDLAYRVHAGDALSEWYRVRVVPPPALRSRRARLRDPQYAGHRERTVDNIQGALEVIEGSEVTLLVEPVGRGDDEKLLCRGEMTFDGMRFALSRDESGLLLSPAFTPRKSGERLIRLLDDYGLTNRSPESVFIKLVPDKVPRVAIKSPGRDLLVLPGEVVQVEAVAEDEFGLRGLSLTYALRSDKDGSRTSRTWTRRDLAEGGVSVANLSEKTELDIAAIGLGPGDVLEYRAEAADFAGDPLMRAGASGLYRVTVISEAEHLDNVLARLRAIQIELMKKAARQKAEASRVGKIAEDAGKPDAGDKVRAAEEREREMARTTEALARNAETLIPELARNPSASPKLLAQMEKLGRAIRSVAREPMSSAVAKLGKAASQGESSGEQKRSLMKDAQKSEKDAAEELERLAKVAERMQRSGILEKLAGQAERLAARQRELKAQSLKTGLETAGIDPKDLPDKLKRTLDRLARTERKVHEGVKDLEKGIDDAAARLMHTKPADAQTAEKAGEKLRTDKVDETTAGLARKIEENVLFSELPTQERVAESLTEVANILRTSAGSQQLEAISKELEEFIKRQTQINANIGAAIQKTATALKPARLGSKQSDLRQDVSEQAGAIEWLARDIQLFRSQTAAKLEAAAREMKSGASWLYRSGLPEGLKHGEKALALLKEAREKFKKERKQMEGQGQSDGSMEALLLLQRILIGQKQLIKATVQADRMPRSDADVLAERTVRLAGKQSRIRVDASRLEEMLERIPAAARVVNMAGGRMDVSRMALEASDTGKETRVVQRQAVALLEKLLGNRKGQMGGMGLAGMRMLAMLQMMQQIGMNPGGYAGGGNAPILPDSLRKTGDGTWRRTHSRFEGQLGAVFDAEYPPEYRKLLEAYFDRLRKEPMR